MSDQNEDKDVVVNENTPGAETTTQPEVEPTTEASTEEATPAEETADSAE